MSAFVKRHLKNAVDGIARADRDSMISYYRVSALQLKLYIIPTTYNTQILPTIAGPCIEIYTTVGVASRWSMFYCVPFLSCLGIYLK